MISLVLGLLVGVMNEVAAFSTNFSKVLEPVVAIFAAFFARLFIEYVRPACFASIVLATIVWYLPGLSLTIGVAELATRNLISGTSRIFYAMLIALELGFGMAVGG